MDKEIDQCKNRLLRFGQNRRITEVTIYTSRSNRMQVILKQKRIKYFAMRNKLMFIGPAELKGTFYSEKFKK